MLRPCLERDCPNLTRGSRCNQHERHQTTEWKKSTSPTILASWRAEHGDWCPGWGRDPHPSIDLTVHHTDQPDTPYTVLCRGCNAAAG